MIGAAWVWLAGLVGCASDGEAASVESLDQIDGVWVGEDQFGDPYQDTDAAAWEVTLTVYAGDATVQVDFRTTDQSSEVSYLHQLGCAAEVPVPGFVRLTDCLEVDQEQHGTGGVWEVTDSFAAGEADLSPAIREGRTLSLQSGTYTKDAGGGS